MAISIHVEVAKSNFDYEIEKLVQEAALKITDKDIEQEKTLLLEQIKKQPIGRNSVLPCDPVIYVSNIITSVEQNAPYKTHIHIDSSNIEVNVTGKNGIYSEDGLNLDDYPQKGAYEVVEITKRLCARDMALYQLMIEGYLMPVVNNGINNNSERLYFNIRCNNGNRCFYVCRERLVFNRFVVVKCE